MLSVRGWGATPPTSQRLGTGARLSSLARSAITHTSALPRLNATAGSFLAKPVTPGGVVCRSNRELAGVQTGGCLRRALNASRLRGKQPRAARPVNRRAPSLQPLRLSRELQRTPHYLGILHPPPLPQQLQPPQIRGGVPQRCLLLHAPGTRRPPARLCVLRHSRILPRSAATKRHTKKG